MELKVKHFAQLKAKEVYEILKARVDVFVVEQHCPYPEIDGKDYESIHIFYEEEGKIAAYLRAFQKDEDTVQMGRVLTVKRDIGIGGNLLKEGIKHIRSIMHPNHIFIEAQCYAIGYCQLLPLNTFGV